MQNQQFYIARKVCWDNLTSFYTKVILPSVTYGLTLWGSCNKTHINNLEKLYARAEKIVYGLPWDTSAEDVVLNANWMGQFGNNVQSAINEVSLQMYKRLHRQGM